MVATFRRSGICLHIDFRNVILAELPHSEGGVTQNGIKNLIVPIQIKILFLFTRFQKPIVSNRLKNIN